MIREARVALLLPGTNRERAEFQKTADGWKYAITEKWWTTTSRKPTRRRRRRADLMVSVQGRRDQRLNSRKKGLREPEQPKWRNEKPGARRRSPCPTLGSSANPITKNSMVFEDASLPSFVHRPFSARLPNPPHSVPCLRSFDPF